MFPLLFLKRISDVYDEERTAALAESGGDEECDSLPEQHPFRVRWVRTAIVNADPSWPLGASVAVPRVNDLRPTLSSAARVVRWSKCPSLAADGRRR